MKGVWTAVLMVSLGAVGLSGCYVVSPYAYPAYVPAYPAPTYVPPSSRGPSPPQQGGPATPPSASGPPGPAPTAPQGPVQNCQTVTVEGHNETRVTPSGQRETIWVPAHEQQVCQ